MGQLDVAILSAVFIVAAIIGDAVNYAVGGCGVSAERMGGGGRVPLFTCTPCSGAGQGPGACHHWGRSQLRSGWVEVDWLTGNRKAGVGVGPVGLPCIDDE